MEKKIQYNRHMEKKEISLDILSEYRRKVEKEHPLVHCITNTITIWDCANILLAAGASPTMAHHPEEVAEITSGCRALVCNLGAMDDFQAMLNAAPVAAKLGHPIVVDPVGCGGSSFRRKRFKELAAVAHISCVRGNASEIRALAEGVQTVTGVDAGVEEFLPESAENADVSEPGNKNEKTIVKDARKLAKELGCIVIASGATDVVTDGEEVYYVTAGDSLMSKITGSGCMSTALLGAYLATENSLESATVSCTTMGLCGERAAARTRAEGGGTMTFHTHLIDEMSLFS